MRFRNGSNKVVIELRVLQFWSEIILVISNRTRAARSFDFEITRMISDQIALHSVQLPLLNALLRFPRLAWFLIFINSVILGELKYFWINHGSCPFAKNLACYFHSELENHIFQNDTFIKPKTLRQQAIRWGPLVSTVVPFPASKHYRLLETAAYQPISLKTQDPHRKARFLGLSPARGNRSRLSLLTRTGWIYLRRGCSRSESDVLYSVKSIKNDFTIALFYFV